MAASSNVCVLLNERKFACWGGHRQYDAPGAACHFSFLAAQCSLHLTGSSSAAVRATKCACRYR